MQPVVCPACDGWIGEVAGSFSERLVLADALGFYHEPLCRAPRDLYSQTTVMWSGGNDY